MNKKYIILFVALLLSLFFISIQENIKQNTLSEILIFICFASLSYLLTKDLKIKKISIILFVFLLSLVFLRLFGFVLFFNTASTSPELKIEQNCMIEDIFGNPITKSKGTVIYGIQEVCIKSYFISMILIGGLTGIFVNVLRSEDRI